MPTTHIRAIPQLEIPGGLRVVPAVAADLTTADSVIFQIVVTNQTDNSVTFTVKDRGVPALSLLSSVNIDARTTYVAAFPEGVFMLGGINWVASAADTLHAEIFATVRSSV